MMQLNFKALMKNDERKPQSLPLTIVCYTAVFSVVTQRSLATLKTAV